MLYHWLLSPEAFVNWAKYTVFHSNPTIILHLWDPLDKMTQLSPVLL